MIAELFGYRLWSAEFLPQLAQQLVQIVRRDVTTGFIVAELIAYLNENKIVRPGYTTLQTVISEALSAERRRLGELLAEGLDAAAKEALAQLLVRDDTLSELAALKQDAKDFGWRQMARERDKRARLEPLYRIAKTLLPKLAVSQQNLHYYASLANFYTVYDLRRLKPEQTHLYLLCYVWQRYRQLTDNLVDALGYHTKQLEDESKAQANKQFLAEQVRRQQDTPQVGRLLLLYVDDIGRRRHALRRRAPARVQDHAQGGPADHRPAPQCEAGEQTGPALGGCRRTGRTHSPSSASALRRAGLFRGRGGQPVAGGTRLDQRGVRQPATPVAASACRMPEGDAAQAFAVVTC